MKIHYFVVLVLPSVLLFGCSSKQENDNIAKAEVQDGLKEQGIKSNSNIIAPNNNSIQTPTFTVNEKVNDVIMVYEIRGKNRKFGFFDKPLIMDKEIKLEWLFWTMDEQLPLGELTVKAIQNESGKSIISKGEIVKKETPLKELPKDYTPKPVSINKSIEENIENDIEINLTFPVSISSTSIKFNESGIWELQLFLNDKSLGNMNVYVTKKNEANIYYLDN
ncbi:DUF4871 domain-containing protein [Peribacillus frigoritolerans]|uniref:DUF4871 domain-containing protein n=1 Tax=Peribacillus frigoritolerans TaxID=450367 RepID=UPI00207B027A|nr:DUF4871 domain-containing protein [Peribacillus frigoritolerans]USK64398.1 DUF4871 domain-containing protein [Peribacillus frigoritolerans]